MSMAIGDDRPTPAGDETASRPVRASRFRFAPTFLIDFVVSMSYVRLLGHLWKQARHMPLAGLASVSIGALIMLSYVGKVLIIRFLERRGGDARTYVESQALVTDGPYAWSRNPTYLLALIQFLLWSSLSLILQAFEPVQPSALAIAMIAPAVFFAVTDRIVIAGEERGLAAAHPEAFAEYTRRVGRWFGRRSRPIRRNDWRGLWSAAPFRSRTGR
jgi:protein-S-isoprenylcysteine O-methyltransferase Ste14